MKNPLFAFVIAVFFSCGSEPVADRKNDKDTVEKVAGKPEKKIADAATILSKKQVPILCYHNIRGTTRGQAYTVPVAAFKDQMKLLADSGYHSVLPDQVYNYLAYGDSLPSKPVMITFDDTDLDQFEIGATEMEKFGFRGVFFIMRISIGKPRYMSREQIRSLADKGHVIASHTWDHHKVTGYKEEDWEKQLVETNHKLEEITGKQIQYFAYPFGLWKPFVIPELQKRNIKAAFQLSAKMDSLQPLYTIRRMIVHGDWDGKRMHKWMIANFK
jgi:peptidoglycan/xylan/chitin deacetylase (PgdA/CDA1 family)